MNVIKGKQVFENLSEMVEPKHTAVLVIDMQNEACIQKGYFAKIGADLSSVGAIVSPLAKFLKSARRAGVKVVYLQQTTLKDGLGDSPGWLHLKEVAYKLKPPATGPEDDYMIEGSWGHEIVEELKPKESDIVVRKYRASGFVNTPLNSVLRSNGIETVVVTGTSSYGCVLNTVMDASCYDYYTIVVRDLVAGPNRELHDLSLKLMGSRFDCVESEAIMKEWEK
ncbi:MAG: cysteine hydrolase family protein [bacterium]